jgi:SnoaL-like domain
MTTYDDIAQRYIDTWNETDPSARRAAVDQLYTEDARYVDPLAAADGREAISSMIGAVQQQFPGFVFTLGGPVDAHHEQARFTWHLGPEGAAEPVVVGFDVAVLNGDGQIRSVYGFLDKVPAA